MQANEAPQERMSAAWRLHKRGYEPRRGSVMVKTIDGSVEKYWGTETKT